MHDIEELHSRLAATLDASARRRAQERSARVTEMRELESKRAEFERTAQTWTRDFIRPRLEELARAFPNASPVDVAPDGCSAQVRLRRTEEYPVSASLAIAVVPDAHYEQVELRTEPTLIPMLAGHPQSASQECDLARAASPPLRFLDDAIVSFVESYARVRDRESPYAWDSFVVDPVCGMRIRRSDAEAVVEHEGKRYHFCAPSCSDRFRLDPPRYLRDLRTRLEGGRP